MENLLLLLPDRPQSVVVRYLLTTLIVWICFLLQLGVELQSGFFGFFLLLPGIFIASLVFDRGSGFYATILSSRSQSSFLCGQAAGSACSRSISCRWSCSSSSVAALPP